MPISHTKNYGIYHWDTFDNETLLVGEADDLAEARQLIKDRYDGRIGPDGADRVEIVDLEGTVVERASVR